MRAECGYRVLAYLDDFLIAPSPHGTVSEKGGCGVAAKKIDAELTALGLTRHPEKGDWEGSTRIEHLGFVLDSVQMKFYIAKRKIERVHQMSARLLREASIGRRWVSRVRLRSFVGICVSLSLAMPYARFYTRSLYWDLARGGACLRRADRDRKRCRLSHQGLRDLRVWRRLTSAEKDGRQIHSPAPQLSLHSDASDVGYGGTLGPHSAQGEPGLWESQGIWGWADRAKSISYRELKAVRLLLQSQLARQIAKEGATHIRLHCDNQAVVHVVNAMVSASRPMMRELRKLKNVLDHLGVHVSSEWLPSVANRYADALSRRFSRDDLQIRRRVRRTVVAGMEAPLEAFPYRPLGEHPVYRKMQAWRELQEPWSRAQVRVLCPPIDLIAAVVRKLRETQAPAVLLIPDWPQQQWHRPAVEMAQTRMVLPLPPEHVWQAARRLNPQWRLLLLEVNL
jgi:hypothetical protein